MLKQMLSLEMLLNGEKMNQGFDFSFSQYCEQLKKHIDNIELDLNFKDLFVKKFYTRFNSVDTIADNFDNYVAMLETEFAIVLPLYNKKYLYIKNLAESDLLEGAVSESESETNADSSQKSNAKSKSFGSSFPSEMVNHDSLEYATDGTHSTSEGDGSSQSNSKVKTITKNTVGSRLDRMDKLLALQQNVIEECVNEFKKLFIMIY